MEAYFVINRHAWIRALTSRTLFVTMEFKTSGLEPSGVPSLDALISSTSGKPYHLEIIVMWSSIVF